jgi:hypothetical protein
LPGQGEETLRGVERGIDELVFRAAGLEHGSHGGAHRLAAFGERPEEEGIAGSDADAPRGIGADEERSAAGKWPSGALIGPAGVQMLERLEIRPRHHDGFPVHRVGLRPATSI